MMKRVAIYARYSTDKQSAASIEDQVRDCRAYVERMGWTVADTYSDAAISGASTHRPDFQRLCADAEDNKFDVLVAESVDRISRDLADTATFKKLLEHNSIQIFVPTMGEITTLHIAIYGHMAEQYLE